MPDFATAVRARLEDFVENALDPQAAAGACLAVLDVHHEVMWHGVRCCDGCSPLRDDGIRRYMLTAWPCPTWLAVTEALGFETPTRGDDDA